MTMEVVSRQLFKDKVEHEPEDPNVRESYPDPLGSIIDQALRPLQSLCDLILLQNGDWTCDGMENDIAVITEALTKHAKDELSRWDADVEQHLGRIVLERATHSNKNHKPGAPIGVQVMNRQEVNNG